MSGAGGSTQQQNLTNQTSTTQLPGWVTGAGQANYNNAVDISSRPYVNYGMVGGQQVAPLDANQLAALGIAGNTGQTLPIYNQALSAAQGMLNYQPTAVNATNITPQTVAGSDITPYMNPYISNVINTTLPIMQQQTQQQVNNANADAARYGAFGGSAGDVQAGVIRSQGALNAGNLASNLYNTGYNTATGLLQGDIQRNLQAQQANQGANLQAATTNASNANTAAQLRNLGISDLSGIASGIQGANTQDIANLMTTGGLDQQTQQMLDSLLTSEFAQGQAYPAQMLGLRESALGMTPYDTSTLTQGVTDATKSSTPDYALAGLGGLNILKGMGGLGGLAGLFSLSEDEDKTDVEKLGKNEAGVDLYAYRYKDDPKTYPKVVGPMASGIEKVKPSAVKKVGKHRVIDLSQMAA